MNMLVVLVIGLLFAPVRSDIFNAPVPIFLPDALYVTSTITVHSTQTIGNIQLHFSTNHTYMGDIIASIRHVETKNSVLLMGFAFIT